jgi:hypothetical protein
VSKCWKQEKTNWREIALFQPKPALSGCTGLSGGAPGSVRWCTGQCPVCQAGSGELGALGNKLTAYDYNSPDCPVVHRTVRWANGRPGQRSAARSARDTWPSQRSGGGTGLSGAHRTVSGAPTAPRCQRSTTPQKERNRHRTVSGVHRTVRCARRQKARFAFLECSQRLLAALGL